MTGANTATPTADLAIEARTTVAFASSIIVVRRQPVLRIFYALAFVLLAMICATSWPGFMSYDSVDALKQAREGMHWNISCPTMVIWAQAICDRIYPGPGLLFVLQVGTTFFALADILIVSEVPLVLGISFMLCFAFSPEILGPTLVVWKDVGFMSFLMLATASLLRAQRSTSRKSFWCWSAILWTLMACSFRINGILAALPIMLFINRELSHNICRRTVIFTWLLTALSVGTIWFINSFQIPKLTVIDPYPAAHYQLFDVLGISALSRDNLLPAQVYSGHRTFTIDDLRNDYCPENFDKAFTHFAAGQKPLIHNPPGEEMTKMWQNAVLKHPSEYLRHRWNVFKALLAIGLPEPHYLTHAGIDANPYGIKFTPSLLTTPVLAYLSWSARTVVGHPWFYYLIGLALFFLGILRRDLRFATPAPLLASAFLHIAPMFFLAPAADLRYNLWSIAAIMLASVLTLNLILHQRGTRMLNAI